MKQGVCIFWAILIGIGGLAAGSIPGGIIGALLGYCLGEKITNGW